MTAVAILPAIQCDHGVAMLENCRECEGQVAQIPCDCANQNCPAHPGAPCAGKVFQEFDECPRCMVLIDARYGVAMPPQAQSRNCSEGGNQ